MIFTPTALAGVYLVDLERRTDERGFFARTWCQREAAAQGITVAWVQFNLSHTRWRGTLRGLHYQRAPHAEGKLVRCTRGAIHDVVVDLRPESATFRQHVAVTLTAAEGRAVYIPPAELAHGFLTLEDEVEVAYQMSAFYAPEHAAGARWDDPALAIPWPAPVRHIADRDAAYPLLEG